METISLKVNGMTCSSCEQRIEKAIYFPTLGVGMEEALKNDTEAVHAFAEHFHGVVQSDLARRVGGQLAAFHADKE